MENKLARLSKNTAAVRFCLPVGFFVILFGAFTLTSNKLVGILVIAAGIALIAFGIWKTKRNFDKSKEMDEAVGEFPTEEFDNFKEREDVTEYYFTWDGAALKPGYRIENAAKEVLFEGKTLNNSVVGARKFEFNNNITGDTREHDVGHVITTTYNNEAFSVKSYFKFDGQNVWDFIHEKGIRVQTSVFSQFPKLTYNVAQNGVACAIIETCSQYVHEEDEAQHKVTLPIGKMYYRFWTTSQDFETLFLLIFAISETNQAVVE